MRQIDGRHLAPAAESACPSSPDCVRSRCPLKAMLTGRPLRMNVGGQLSGDVGIRTEGHTESGGQPRRILDRCVRGAHVHIDNRRGGCVFTVPLTESGVDPSFRSHFLIWMTSLVRLSVNIEIGGDGIAHLNAVNNGVLQLQRAGCTHVAAGIGQIGRPRDNCIGPCQGTEFRNFCAPESETSSSFTVPLNGVLAKSALLIGPPSPVMLKVCEPLPGR